MIIMKRSFSERESQHLASKNMFKKRQNVESSVITERKLEFENLTNANMKNEKDHKKADLNDSEEKINFDASKQMELRHKFQMGSVNSEISEGSCDQESVESRNQNGQRLATKIEEKEDISQQSGSSGSDSGSSGDSNSGSDSGSDSGSGSDSSDGSGSDSEEGNSPSSIKKVETDRIGSFTPGEVGLKELGVFSNLWKNDFHNLGMRVYIRETIESSRLFYSRYNIYVYW